MTTAVRLVTVAEIVAGYKKKRSYVYRLASLHGWRRIRYGRDVYYDLSQVDAVLGKDSDWRPPQPACRLDKPEGQTS